MVIQNVELPAGHEFMCMAPHLWGRGKTVEEAKKQARRFGPIYRKYRIFIVPEDATVDDMGYVVCHNNCEYCMTEVT